MQKPDTQNAQNVTHFDVVGDIHGCYYELEELVQTLGYKLGDDGLYEHPEDRTMVFLGDITDRGYYNSLSLQFVYNHWIAGKVLWVQGNHDGKLFRWMKGNPVKPGHGLQKTISELKQAWPFEKDREEMGIYLLEKVPTRIILDGGNVVAVHAANGKYRNDHMYGYRGGPDNSRIKWWEDYEGPPFVVFGHYWLNDPEPREYWCCVDTSCVCGESLTALRWPEKEITQVEANQVYYKNS